MSRAGYSFSIAVLLLNLLCFVLSLSNRHVHYQVFNISTTDSFFRLVNSVLQTHRASVVVCVYASR